MKQEIFQALAVAGNAIALAIIGYATSAFSAWLKDRELGKELGNFAFIADMVVQNIEQIAKSDATLNKIEEAKAKFITIANDRGLKVTDTMVDTFLEAAVKRMNDAGKGNEVDVDDKIRLTRRKITDMARESGIPVSDEEVERMLKQGNSINLTSNKIPKK